MRGASISRCHLSPSQAVLLSGYGSAASRMPSHRDDAPPFQRPPSRGRAYHPTNLLRVNMAAMGIVDDSVDENSGLSAEAVGSWYGTTAKTGRVSRPRCTGPRAPGRAPMGAGGDSLRSARRISLLGAIAALLCRAMMAWCGEG